MHGRHLSLWFLLFLLWLFFSGSLSPVSLLVGAILAAALALIFSRLELPYDVHRSERPRFSLLSFLRRLFVLFLFLPVFGWKVVSSGFYIASLALKPSIDFWPGIVRIKGDLPNRTALTVLANLITLTPGTLSLDYDEENDELYVHWIDLAVYGGEEMDKTITSGMRPWVRRMFE